MSNLLKLYSGEDGLRNIKQALREQKLLESNQTVIDSIVEKSALMSFAPKEELLT